MAYDEELADRIRELVGSERDVSEMRMFGGIAFLINGNMAVAASGQGGLMVRVDAADTEKLLTEPEAQPMVMRGRELAGWLRVDTTGLTTEKQLRSWVDRGIAYAGSLPAKKGR
jgi:TfoX/Sxy family transcriptional regulator of competence genes